MDLIVSGSQIQFCRTILLRNHECKAVKIVFATIAPKLHTFLIFYALLITKFAVGKGQT